MQLTALVMHAVREPLASSGRRAPFRVSMPLKALSCDTALRAQQLSSRVKSAESSPI
jgi:hypothetical protein